MRFFILALLLSVHVASALDAEARRTPSSVIRVNSTCQPYDIAKPWAKKAPFTRSGVGAILADNRVLVTAEMVMDHIVIEFEKPGSAEKSSARLLAVDYEANLALLEPVDAPFFADFTPLALDTSAVVGDRLSVWQLETNGTLITTDALLTNVAVGPYPMDGVALLSYQLTAALQAREGSFTLPLMKEGQLAGFSMRFDPRTQNLTAISAQVIEHFLTQVQEKKTPGFPKAGVTFAETRDPMFRSHIGLDGRQGVYITEVSPGSPGAKAGIASGDVLLKIGAYEIDRDGNYSDPVHGKLSLVHLISGQHFPGDRVSFTLLRDGAEKTVDVILEARGPETFISPPYGTGEPPRFVIAGGLFFQELSRDFLKAYGKNWEQQANQRLVYYDRYQNVLFPEADRRIVFLRGVIPTEGNMGYHDLDSLVVTRINGRDILRLEDLVAALQHPDKGFHRIEFEDDPGIIILNAARMDAENEKLKDAYGLPILQRL